MGGFRAVWGAAFREGSGVPGLIFGAFWDGMWVGQNGMQKSERQEEFDLFFHELCTLEPSSIHRPNVSTIWCEMELLTGKQSHLGLVIYQPVLRGSHPSLVRTGFCSKVNPGDVSQGFVMRGWISSKTCSQLLKGSASAADLLRRSGRVVRMLRFARLFRVIKLRRG